MSGTDHQMVCLRFHPSPEKQTISLLFILQFRVYNFPTSRVAVHCHPECITFQKNASFLFEYRDSSICNKTNSTNTVQDSHFDTLICILLMEIPLHKRCFPIHIFQSTWRLSNLFAVIDDIYFRNQFVIVGIVNRKNEILWITFCNM